MIRCVHCGYENPPNYQFCQNCGNSLKPEQSDISTFEIDDPSQISDQIPDDIPADLVEQASFDITPEQSEELMAEIAAADFMNSSVESTSDGPESEITKVIQPKPKFQLRHLAYAGLTDVGRSRDHNEDDFVILGQGFYRETAAQQVVQDHKGLFIVCDGMGGHDGGEVASALAIAEITQHFNDFWQRGIPSEAELRQILLKTNQAIFNLNEQEARRDLGRMGTTLVLLAIHNHQVAIAHVGDSRIYRVTDRKLEQLTRDHEVANRLIDQGMSEAIARARYDAHQLTQALGPFDAQMVNPSLSYFTLTEPTLFLLCSDGLCDDDLVEQHWENSLLPLLEPDSDLKTGVQDLVNLANYFNGHDNITAIAVQCLMT